ncbi:MAG: ComEA family DNA-binding protein [Planctomycetota bacterium]
MDARRASALVLLVVSALAAWSGAGSLVSHAPVDPRYRVDINAASAEELEVLPRVGPALAGAIVASREADGAFAGVDDLDRVPRIGEKTVERIRPYAIAR